jgi:hypothetical protein
MTGRELIIYILQNGLENVSITDKNFLNLITVEQAAVKFNVGVETIKVWYVYGAIQGIRIGDELYILANAEPKGVKDNG